MRTIFSGSLATRYSDFFWLYVDYRPNLVPKPQGRRLSSIGFLLVSPSLSLSPSLFLSLVVSPVANLSRGFCWPVRAKRSLWDRSSQRSPRIPVVTSEPSIPNVKGPLGSPASKSSLPCPGEEAPPRPKSLVGVGTGWLRPRGGSGLRSPPRPGATKPSRPVGREAVAATKGLGRSTTKREAPVDRPRAAVVPPPQFRGDRLPACHE